MQDTDTGEYTNKPAIKVTAITTFLALFRRMTSASIFAARMARSTRKILNMRDARPRRRSGGRTHRAHDFESTDRHRRPISSRPQERLLCLPYQRTRRGRTGRHHRSRKAAFYQRIADSPYLFEISSCNSGDEDAKDAAYFLTAVPRHPRMPTRSWCSPAV